MLDALKADNKIWKGILDCKMVKEDIKSFEKKVKNQFSQTPFEDIDSESGNEEKNKNNKDNDKSEDGIENMEVDGDEISNGKAETKKLANGNHGTANGKDISRNDNENCTKNKLQEKKTITNGSSDDTPSKKKGKEDDLDRTVPFVGSEVDEKVSEPEDDLDKTMPFDQKKKDMEEEKLNSVGSKRKKKPLAGPASKVKKQKTDDSQENTEVEDKYESVLKVNLKICDTDENLLDSKYAKGCYTEKNILVYNLDKSVTEEGLIDYFKI